MSSSNGSATMDNSTDNTIVNYKFKSLNKSSDSVDSAGSKKSTRRCMFGCTDGSSTLCRFPVHDAQRCQDWIDFFQVSENHIKDNSLVNLRVCMKHFKEKITMINGKVTRHPSVDSVNSNQSSKEAKRSRHSSTSGWNGVGSAASSVHSDYTSDSESRSKPSNESKKSIKNLPIGDINGGNRKLFVITQSDDTKTEGGVPGQKSKMFLILENGDDNDETKKHQKITLIADKSDAQTAERIEQLLPQLIERIQNGNEPKCPKESVVLLDSDDEQSQHSIQAENSDLPIQIQRVETLANIAPPVERKAVNLSSDFLFLMKMVPKLEAIAQPMKTHIKNRIESMLTDPLNEIAFEDSYVPKLSGVVKSFSDT